MRVRRLVVSVMAVLLTVGLLPAAAGAGGHGGPDRSSQGLDGGPPGVLVGAASRSVLPTVDGAHDYLDTAALPDDADGVDPGVFVPDWDAGRVAVGNGAADSHWVRDDLRVRAAAVEDLRGRDITVLLAADLYMIFRPDADEIRRKARALLPPGLARRTTIVVTATHNHHGPDTAFDVNHAWYDQMTDQAAAAVAAAVADRQPANLRVGQGQHWFGVVDGRDPMVIDPTLNVMQATAANGDVITTLVQWNNHPETTLFWDELDEKADVADDCRALDEGTECRVEGRYFTSDFAGALSRTIEAEAGGVALYFNGAVGGLTTPLDAPVWEITDDVGIGDHYTPPDGAQVPDGMDGFSGKSFRKAVIIGEQAADAAMEALDEGEPVADPRVTYRAQEFYTRMSHIGFRALSVVDGNGRSSLGHNPAMLYTCPAPGPKTDATCEPDEFRTVDDDEIGQIRAGDHTKSEVGYLTIGTVGMMFLPAEVASELTIGLPGGFPADSTNWFAGPMDRHATGDEYALPGYVTNLMQDEYEWTIGLGNDEMGYAIPISDWRLACVAGADACQSLYDAGIIAYPDALAGTQCKEVTEDPSQLDGLPAGAAQAVAASCRYGQVAGEPADHYEETNAVGWDLAADIMAAVSDLTGVVDESDVNPDFAGHWEGLLPPG